MRQVRLLILIAILIPAGVHSLLAQSNTAGSNASADSTAMAFGYRFEGPRFYESLIEVDVAADGTGEVRVKRGESDDLIDRKFKLLPATLARIRYLHAHTNFIDSSEEYQDKKDFSNMGWVMLWARQDGRERKVRFNYTGNAEIRELADILRAVATQELRLFDIETAERYQPLDLPKQIELLENELRLVRIAEPEQMIATLNEISGDDTQPLIARNHARRIIEAIKKGKYKSPIKGSR